MARTTPLKIVIAYDSYTDGIRAWELSERLASRFREDLGVDRDLWKFDLLRDPSPPVRQASLAAVTQADLVMVAAGGLEDLSADIRDWIDNWPPRRGGAWTALVASVGPDAQRSAGCSPMFNYLRQRAEDAGMEFFGNAENWPITFESLLGPDRFVPEQCKAELAGNFGRQEPGW
jgi:hypothetical protein